MTQHGLHLPDPSKCNCRGQGSLYRAEHAFACLMFAADNPSPPAARDALDRDQLIALIDKYCDIGDYGSGSSDPEGLADAILAAALVVPGEALAQLATDELNRLERDWARLVGDYPGSTTVVPIREVRTALNAVIAAARSTPDAPRPETL